MQGSGPLRRSREQWILVWWAQGLHNTQTTTGSSCLLSRARSSPSRSQTREHSLQWRLRGINQSRWLWPVSSSCHAQRYSGTNPRYSRISSTRSYTRRLRWKERHVESWSNTVHNALWRVAIQSGRRMLRQRGSWKRAKRDIQVAGRRVGRHHRRGKGLDREAAHDGSSREDKCKGCNQAFMDLRQYRLNHR